MLGSIANYAHPYVTVDGVLLRVCQGALEVYLIPRPADDINRGKMSLPGGFLDIEARLDDTLKNKYFQKTGLTDFYTEQLKTFDALDRDPRGRVLSVSYLCLTADQGENAGWYRISKDLSVLSRTGAADIPMQALAFDHGELICEAVLRLRGKLAYTDLARHLLPDAFFIRDAQTVFDAVLDTPMANFWRWISPKCEEAEQNAQPKLRGRPATRVRWKKGV